MEFQQYPKWKYAKDSSVVVESAKEEAALSGDWYDSPADIPAEGAAAAPAAKASKAKAAAAQPEQPAA